MPYMRVYAPPRILYPIGGTLYRINKIAHSWGYFSIEDFLYDNL